MGEHCSLGSYSQTRDVIQPARLWVRPLSPSLARCVVIQAPSSLGPPARR